MAKYYRGDTLPVVASYDGYRFKPGDVVTAGILKRDDEESDYNLLAEVSLTVTSEADKVQLEFSREQMHDIEGDVVCEVRTVMANGVEMSIQKSLTIGRDGLR